MQIVRYGQLFPQEISSSVYLIFLSNNKGGAWRALSQLSQISQTDNLVVFLRDAEFESLLSGGTKWDKAATSVADYVVLWIDKGFSSGKSVVLEDYIKGKTAIDKLIVVGQVKYLKTEGSFLRTYSDPPEFVEFLSSHLMVAKSPKRMQEVFIPTVIWNSDIFQFWYCDQRILGNKLLEVESVDIIRSEFDSSRPYLWKLRLKIFDSTKRVTVTKTIIGSPDMCSVVMLHVDESGDIKVVFSRAGSEDSLYLPYGMFSDYDAIVPIIDDLVKIKDDDSLDVNRLRFLETRRVLGSLFMFSSYLYMYQLSQEEMEAVSENEDFCVLPFSAIFGDPRVSWSDLAQVCRAVLEVTRSDEED
jgi:hypothetical protein